MSFIGILPFTFVFLAVVVLLGTLLSFVIDWLVAKLHERSPD